MLGEQNYHRNKYVNFVEVNVTVVKICSIKHRNVTDFH